MDEKRHFFVIVNYNGGDHITHCIHHILRSIDLHPLIVIVDNASTDQSLEKCKVKYPNLTYIYNTHNIGFAAAANIGTRYALERNATTITYCNPDAQLTPDCAYQLISAVTQDNYAIVSPFILDHTHKKPWFCGGKVDYFHFRATHTYDQDLTQKIVKSDFISGCVMTVASSTFALIGLFDEQFFLYYEDVDFSLRTRSKNLPIGIVSKAIAYHDEISESHKNIKIYFLVLSGLLCFKKHVHGLQKIWFYLHFWLRRAKNRYDLRRSHPYAHSVYKAFLDYETIV